MKKEYEKPQMNISSFESENIMSISGINMDQIDDSYDVKNYAEIDW